MDIPWLSLLVLVSLGGAFATFFAGRYARWAALVVSLGSLVIVLAVMALFQPSLDLQNTSNSCAAGGFQLCEVHTWFTYSSSTSAPGFSVDYAVGIDGISLVLILLSAVITVAAVVYHWSEERDPHGFFGLLLLTNAGCIGVFVSLDVLLFFVFWEIVLIPMFFLIGHWGGPRRHYAALKFFVYTHVASVTMFVALLAMVFLGHWDSFDFVNTFQRQQVDNMQNIPSAVQALLFGSLLFGFGVKLPMVPFHTWLPDAHVEAPTGGSVLLAGILLKLGGYGLIRLASPMLPAGRSLMLPVMLFLAFLSIVWGAYLSLAQRDLKRLVAYSSINHMGIVLLAIALWTQLGVMAAVLLMFAHGLVSALLFMVSGSVHHTFGTRDIPSVGGMTARTPVLSTMLMIGSLASLGLPALVSFPAEFSAFLATWNTLGYWVLLPLMALVVTAGFYIWMMQRMSFGPTRGIPANAHDLPFPEVMGMSLLVGLIVLYGILPLLIEQVIPIAAIFGVPCGAGGMWGACPSLP
ncbi:MAG: NADH-quinone oxidoreductase subunit M [Euryarchaeota archaeon]|nr:NADH-quinone oxidoreductase subunit M [Euryarchaeota archaeon]MDE1835214.1 NADH-quinone oxidoreductase subunit M [Euryarchaeota archaeon]MDE1880071.1 NADH-quinone oxidoreductase subunit M [Euryarchaeota archaeon]MDE2043510.1 NADH-quinone oxidoreductase subunit M [Thermoplasmata archaeon]